MKMFLMRPGYVGTTDKNEADIFVLTGGADVEPAYYGERPHRETHFSEARDDYDSQLMCDLPKDMTGKMLVGICRGGQFLNVWHGGRMWQHVDGHAGIRHILQDVETGELVKVTSTHHQMMRPGDKAEIWVRASCNGKDEDDIEVLWYPHARALCFQPHPEFDDAKETTDYFFSLIQRFI